MNSKAQVKEKRGHLVQFHVCMPFGPFCHKNFSIFLDQKYSKVCMVNMAVPATQQEPAIKILVDPDVLRQT